MKWVCVCLICAALCFSTGCGDTSSHLCEAVPFDVVYQVRSEYDLNGVLISDLGTEEAFLKAEEIFGVLDGVDSFAVFIPYSGGSVHGKSSDRNLSTFTQPVVDKSACCEFGVLRLDDAESEDGIRLFERVCERTEPEGGYAVRQGRFIVYSLSDDRFVNDALKLLLSAD